MNGYDQYYIEKWFAPSINPGLLETLRRLPHYVERQSSAFLKKISVLTTSKPAPWPAAPTYDDNGKDVLAYDIEQSFDKWTNDYNQAEIMRSCDGLGFYGFYGNTWIVVDSSLGEKTLSSIMPTDPEQSTIRGLESLIKPAIDSLDQIKWFVLPDGADRDYFLFVCCQECRGWIEQLKSEQ